MAVEQPDPDSMLPTLNWWGDVEAHRQTVEWAHHRDQQNRMERILQSSFGNRIKTVLASGKIIRSQNAFCTMAEAMRQC